jgi:transcription antitermination factor NusG
MRFMAAACLDGAQDSAFRSQLDWFAVQVIARREITVAAFLREKGYEEFVPTQPARKRRSPNGDRQAIFPGYVFCRMDEPIGARLCTTPGFIRIVGFGNMPVPIPRDEIESIRQALAAGFYASPASFLHAGDFVRVREGPLAGVQGKLVRHASGSSLVLSVTLLQSAVSVQVNADDVELISRGMAQ